MFIFPGLGLGAIAAETRAITDRMFLLAARTLAEAVSPSPAARPARSTRRSASCARSRARSRAVVAREAIDAGLAGIPADTDIDALVDAAMWWPAYVPYVPGPAGRATAGRRGDVTATRAAVLRAPGAPVAIETLTLAEPRAGEVRVRILASGVCHSDLHVRDGEWPRPTPVAMGHEGAGVVEAVGPGVRSLSVGQPVALSWLVPCGTCRSCRAGRPWACPDSPSFRHRMPDGATVLATDDGEPVLSYCGIGTMAEATVVPEAAAIAAARRRRPGASPRSSAAACRPASGPCSRRPTSRSGRASRSSGSAASGLSCVMGAVLAGAGRIVAIDRVEAKLAVARSMGATDGLLAGDDPAATIEALRELTDGGPDFVFEAIGRIDTVELAIECLPLGGTAVLVGMTPFEARASFAVYPLVDGSRRILGSNYGFADPPVDFPRYAALHLEGRLPVERLIDRRIGLDDIEPAFDRLRAGDGLRQVVVFD